MTEKGPSEPSADGPPVYPDSPPSPPPDEIEGPEPAREVEQLAPVAVAAGDAGDARDDDYDDAEAPAARRRAEGGPPWPLIIGWLVVIGLAGILAFLLSSNSDDEETPTTDTSSSGTTEPETTEPDTTEPDTPVTVPENFVEFTDEQTGFSLSYPQEWERLEPTGTDPTVRLIVSAGGLDSMLVRVFPLDGEVNPDNLPGMQELTDGIINQAQVRVLSRQPIEVNGMPGYYYIYLFNEATTGQEGVHAHYFLFKGATMNTVVFQTVPVDRFEALAPTFDAISTTFESDPPETPPSTEPPAEDTTTTTSG